MKRTAAVFAVLCTLQGSVPADDARNAAGILSQVIYKPFGFDDPYSWMVGGGAYYERRFGARRPSLVLGARAAVFGQYGREPLFDRSMTILAGPYAGWEIASPELGDLTCRVVPYAGYAQYWRSFSHDGTDYRASRPVLVVGVAVDLELGARISCGIAAEPMLIMDRTPLAAFGQMQRLALRF